MIIFFYKGLARNPEFGNVPSEFCLISGDWDKFGADVSNEMLLYAAKGQGYSFYRFWVIKGKPTGGKSTPPSHPD